MNKIHKIIILLFFVIFIRCKEDEPLLPSNEPSKEFNQNNFGIDTYNRIIIYNGASIDINSDKLVFGNYVFNIETTDKKLLVGKEYLVKHNEQVFKMFLTELPIILITTNDVNIIDEPKIKGRIKIFENNNKPYTSFIGVELRGGVSQLYPKKSYSVELWKNENGDTRNKKSLLGMRVDDDWILDGMWNEPNRIRDFTSHDIWLKIGRVQNSKNNTKIGIDRKYCELFVNGKYKGVYYIGEKIDRKQLDLDKYDNKIEGELYKGFTWAGAVTYTGINEIDNSLLTWSGYEAKYPNKIGKVNWCYLYDHVNFVLSSSQLDFNNAISSRIDIDNMVDYYIFLNLIYATDNTGKNVYTCKFDNSSLYFFVPWDMDGSFGNDWTGKRSDITDKMLSNGLYNKLLNYSVFKRKVKSRWTELRVSTLNTNNIKQMFRDNYDYLEKNGVYLRESLVPDITQNYSNIEIDFIESWIDRRVVFLDTYFNDL